MRDADGEEGAIDWVRVCRVEVDMGVAGTDAHVAKSVVGRRTVEVKRRVWR